MLICGSFMGQICVGVVRARRRKAKIRLFFVADITQICFIRSKF